MDGKKTILLVEDEVLIALAEKLTLEKYGYAVRIAGTGEEALAAAPTADLVLMDINLGPGMDGTEAAQIILEQQEVPLVFLSSHIEPEIVARTEKITSYGYIVKNSGETVLLASIRMAFRLFDAHRLLRETEIRQAAMISSKSDVIVILNDDGTVRYISPNAEKLFGWKIEEILGTYHDVTERRRTEEHLREHSRYLDAVLQTTADGFWVVDSQGRIIETNEAYCRMSGYNRDELRSMTALDLDADDGPSQVEERMRRIRETGWEVFETRHRRRDGELIDIEISVSFLDQAGGQFICFCRDIGERKRTEEVLRSREALQRLLTVLATEMINVPLDEVDNAINRMLAEVGMYTRFDRTFVFRNDWERGISINTHEWCAPGIQAEIENLQAVPLEELTVILDVHRRGERFLIPAVRDLPEDDSVRRILEPQGVQSTLLLPLFQDGVYAGYVGFDAVRQRREFAGETVELLAIMTELIASVLSRQTADGVLRRERQRLAGIIAGTGAGTWEWNVQTSEVTINQRWAEIIGCTKEELAPVTLATFRKYTNPEDLEDFDRAVERHLQGETEQYEAEVRMRHRDGRWVWVLNRGRVVTRSEDGQPLMMMGTLQDISTRKHAEQLLQDDAMRFRSLLDGIRSVPVQSIAPDGEVLYWNTASEELYGYTAEEALGKNIMDLVIPAELLEPIRNTVAQAFTGGQPVDPREDWLSCKDGKRVCVLTSFAIVEIPGRIPELFSIDVDVTEQRRAEDRARRLVQEKETLIKEVQHRIKNTMNTMSSFLSLQADSLDDPAAVAALNDARSRFQSMAVLYDQLYRAEAHDYGSAGAYLTELVQRAVELFPGGETVTVDTAFGTFSLNVRQLSVVGMIVNELVINAMKYAFADVPAGVERRLSLRADVGDGQLTLAVADNGRGMDMNGGGRSGFGLTMVDALAGQLGGTLRIESERGGGTRAQLVAPVAVTVTGGGDGFDAAEPATP